MPVGKLVFKRGLMGRMVKQRANIMKTGILSLDFQPVGQKKEKENFEARCCGEEEKVRKAISFMIELAEGCGFVPSKPIIIIYFQS